MAEKLTAKQEAFCNGIADGLNQADAYRSAYQGISMTDKTIQEAACRLMANSKVQARVTELKSRLEKKQLWTREMSVKVLGSIASKTESPHSARVSAVRELNLMHGYNEPSKLDITTAGGPINKIEIVPLVGKTDTDT